MSKVKIVLNSAGIREMLKSDGAQALITQYCETVQRNAGGEGYEISVQVGRNRTVGEVHAVSKEALNDVFKNNALLKALHK